MSTTNSHSTVHSFSREIVTLICNHSASDKALGTLGALACTAKAFRDPALDSLWRSIPGIVPLLYSLPSDLWEIKEQPILGVRNGIMVLNFRRAPTPEDFVRFHTYAKRVKEVRAKQSYPGVWSPLISPVAWAALRHAIPGPLLPNITSLTHSEACTTRGCDTYCWPTDLVVGSKLRYVALAVRPTFTEPKPAERIFSTLSRDAPYITRVNISIALSFGAPISMSLGAELSGLRHLVSFKAPSLDLLPEAVEHLASLPNLAYLSMKTKVMDTATTAFPHTAIERTGRFPALVKARIYTNCFVWCAALVSTISSLVLRELLIENRSCPAKTPAFESLLAAVGQLPCTCTLRNLSIFSGEDHACLHPGPTIVCAEAVLPLAALTALRLVRITGWCEVVLNDAVLGTLARAWPALQHLDVRFPLSHPELIFSLPVSYPLVTLPGLAVLAGACPNLDKLLLAVDARVVPELEPTLGGRRGLRPTEVTDRNHPLRHLDVGESPIGDAMKVASYLSLFFPALKEVYHGFGEDTPWQAFWDAYLMFAKIRAQERKARQRRLAAAANTGPSASV